MKIFDEDGILEEESLLEIKCPGSPKYKMELLPSKIPVVIIGKTN